MGGTLGPTAGLFVESACYVVFGRLRATFPSLTSNHRGGDPLLAETFLMEEGRCPISNVPQDPVTTQRVRGWAAPALPSTWWAGCCASRASATTLTPTSLRRRRKKCRRR